MAPPRARRAGSRSRRAQRQPVRDGRLVKERIRHISPRSVLKISVIFYTCVALVFLVAGLLLWSFAGSTGTVDDTESFITQLFTYGDCVPEDQLELGQEFRESDQCPEGRVMVGGFELDGGAVLRAGLTGSFLFVVAATSGTLFMVVLFNILSDVTGGIRYTVVREPLGSQTGSTSGGVRR